MLSGLKKGKLEKANESIWAQFRLSHSCASLYRPCSALRAGLLMSPLRTMRALLGDATGGQRPKRVDVLGDFVAQSLTSHRRATQR